MEASSPFGGMRKVKETLELPVVCVKVHAAYAKLTHIQFAEVARQLNITPTQVVLSWLRQRGVVVLPKSVHPDRIEENIRGNTANAGAIPTILIDLSGTQV